MAFSPHSTHDECTLTTKLCVMTCKATTLSQIFLLNCLSNCLLNTYLWVFHGVSDSTYLKLNPLFAPVPHPFNSFPPPPVFPISCNNTTIHQDVTVRNRNKDILKQKGYIHPSIHQTNMYRVTPYPILSPRRWAVKRQRHTVVSACHAEMQRKTYTESFISFCVFDNQEKKV